MVATMQQSMVSILGKSTSATAKSKHNMKREDCS
jgi:hypothetical protein